MRTYYCVTTTITDNGTTANLTTVAKADTKPQGEITTTSADMDIYIDEWFDTAEDAQAHVNAMCQA